MFKLILLILLFVNLNALEPISPIPTIKDYDEKKALLGKKLFFDTILSRDNSTSCLSCHNIYDGGADSREVSRGFNNKKGNIQSPTVLNAKYNFAQFWNGRAKDLYEQASGPLNNPVEHNMDSKSIEKKLNNSTQYKKIFKKVYNVNFITYNLVIDAIVEFEKALTTPNSRFDKYLKGELKLSDNEKDGYKLFKHYGCITCHNGINIGGNSFQQIGIFTQYKNNNNYPDRSVITKNTNDKNVFKVPTLRNIELTAPYFHDAHTNNLNEAVNLMAIHNLGVNLPQKDIKLIVKFLKTLTGEKPKILDKNENF